MFPRLFITVAPKELSLIKQVHAAHTPSLLSYPFYGLRWLHKAMGLTLDWVTDPNKSMQLQNVAQSNLSRWSESKVPPPRSVDVVYKDWGDATLEATKRHGLAYSVLNMANPVFPGGAALKGGNAQEENMWIRSTCAISLLDKFIIFDKDSMTFRYNEMTTKLIEARLRMTDEERESLKESRSEIEPTVYRVFYSRDPRVCFRGQEVDLITSGFEGLRNHATDKRRSYAFLPDKDIFPFYELRSAAPELTYTPKLLDSESLEKYKADLRRRIAAQLDTLIKEGQRYAILGAWGCGQFHNAPEIVAEIYREEIEKRADSFDHIVFPIINTGPKDNHAIFEEALTDLKLGGKSTPTASHGG